MSDASVLTNQIIDFVYKQGGYAWRSSSVGVFDQQAGGYRTASKKGVSDILACLKGRLIAIEVKIGADRLSSEQTGFLKNIEHVGAIAIVAKDFPNFLSCWQEKVVQ